MQSLRPAARIHLVGIGGIGLSAIARVLRGWGYQVSGSDRQASALTAALAAEGITISIGHAAEHVRGADVVVVSSAIPEDNPEIQEARRLGLPVVKRQQFLDELTATKTTLAVAGTHGKTTTSAMIAWILSQAVLDPTFIVGGVLQNLGTNAKAGKGPHFVIEADEYDRAFLGLSPSVAVVTTLEHDHPDCYPTFGEMQDAFHAFVRQTTPSGLLITCGEDPEATALGAERKRDSLRVETYGFDHQCDWHVRGVHLGNSAAFEVWYEHKKIGTCALQVPGRHNVLNALAATAVAHEVGVPFETAASALTRFRGTARRFEIKGQAGGVTVVDDYAHHPTEIQATLAAARAKYGERSIWAVFQPHTYSRTRAMLDEFANSFQDADHVVVTAIYAAREIDTLGISGADIVSHSAHPDIRYVESLRDTADKLVEWIQPGDVVITLGAGDGYVVGEQILEHLAREVGAK